MLNFIKGLFRKEEDLDPMLTELRTQFRGNWKRLDDDEQAVLALRLSGLQQDSIAIALSLTIAQVKQLEAQVLEKLKKR
jgi:DNA-directed RNA polymerase specialized sigma subunit